jgi:hypothetical protein
MTYKQSKNDKSTICLVGQMSLDKMPLHHGNYDPTLDYHGGTYGVVGEMSCVTSVGGINVSGS